MLIVIGKSAITLYISSMLKMLEEKTIF